MHFDPWRMPPCQPGSLSASLAYLFHFIFSLLLLVSSLHAMIVEIVDSKPWPSLADLLQNGVRVPTTTSGRVDHATALGKLLCPRFLSLETDYDEFRELQRKYGLLVVGITALEFFDNCNRWQSSRLDLIVGRQHYDEVVQWLQSSGLRRRHGFHTSGLDIHSRARSQSFVSRVSIDWTIRLCETVSDPIEYILSSSSSELHVA